MTTEAADQMWQEFSDSTGVSAKYTAWAFADDSMPELATELGLLVRDGPKRATAGLLSEYEKSGEPLPQIGEYSVILDGQGKPLCIIRTTELTVKRLADVDEQFAWDEGEGERTLSWWKQAHIRFFARLGVEIDDDTEMVHERFELVWPR